MNNLGMSLSQFQEIVTFSQTHHPFYKANLYQLKSLLKQYNGLPEYGYSFKYIDSCYDSRYSCVWSISFRGFRTITFTSNLLSNYLDKDNSFAYTSLYEWVMAFLKGEWKEDDIHYNGIMR